jgi:hypothetical protein
MLACNAEGSFITEMSDGSLTCAIDHEEMPRLSSMTSPVPSFDQWRWYLGRSLSDTVYDGVFTKLVTDNFTNACGS